MTPEQFVFWLRGYLASGDIGNFTRGDAKAIAEELAKVVPPAPPPQPQPWWERLITSSPHPFRPVEITCGQAAEVRNAS